MSFSYDANLGTTRDFLRFRLDDTVQATAFFQDEEIDAVLTRFGTSDDGAWAAYILAMRGYLRATRDAIQYQKGVSGVNTSLMVDRRQVPQWWLKLAQAFKDEAINMPNEAVDSYQFSIDPYGRDTSDYVGQNVYGGVVICDW